jgi:DNA-binding NarL/FixJ family response regulator
MPEMFKEIINVLIVEDNLVLRETLSWLLKSPKNTFDYHVMEAASGEQAVKKAMDHNFDIIIMDYRMPPGISGLEATQQILRLKPEIKILSYTTDLYIVKDMVEAGARGGISKNFHKGEMDHAIKTVLIGQTYFSIEIAEAINYSDRFNK